MIAKPLEQREIFDLGNGEVGTIKDYSRKTLKAVKDSGVVGDPFKQSADELVSKMFPEIDRSPVAYNASIIDLIKSIRSTTPGADGEQFVLPMYRNVPKDKTVIFKGPTVGEQLRMFEANAAAGGTPDFEEFKSQLFNRQYHLLAVDPSDYLEVKFGGEKKSIKEAHTFGDMSYDDLDLKESLYKIIEDRTGLGVGALFQEEMNDRRTTR